MIERRERYKHKNKRAGDSLLFAWCWIPSMIKLTATEENDVMNGSVFLSHLCLHNNNRNIDKGLSQINTER